MARSFTALNHQTRLKKGLCSSKSTGVSKQLGESPTRIGLQPADFSQQACRLRLVLGTLLRWQGPHQSSARMQLLLVDIQ